MFLVFSDFVRTVESDAQVSARQCHDVDILCIADDALVFEVFDRAGFGF